MTDENLPTPESVPESTPMSASESAAESTSESVPETAPEPAPAPEAVEVAPPLPVPPPGAEYAAPAQWPAAPPAPAPGYPAQPAPVYAAPAAPVYAAAAPTSSNAVVALILAVASWAVCPIVAAVVALVFASTAAKEIDASGGRVQGSGLVTAARIVAWVNIGLFVAGIVIFGFVFILLAVLGGVSSTTG